MTDEMKTTGRTALVIGATPAEWSTLLQASQNLNLALHLACVPASAALGADQNEVDGPALVVCICESVDDWPQWLRGRRQHAGSAAGGLVVGVLRHSQPGDAEKLADAGADLILEAPLSSREAVLLLSAVQCFHLRHEAILSRALAGQTEVQQRTPNLWEAEMRFRLYAEQSPDAMLVLASDRVILDANPVACELLSTPRDQLIGGVFDAFVSSEQIAIFRKAVENWFAGAENAIVCDLIAPHSARRQGEIRAIAMGLSAHPAVILQIRDLRERHQLERQYQEAQTRYQRLVEQIPAITYVFDLLARRTTYVSPQIETMLGFSPEAWRQDPNLWLRQIHPEDRDRVRHLVCEVHDFSHEPFLLEYRVYAADGREVWLENRGSYLNLGDRWLLQGVMIDVTARRRAEQEIRSGWERLVQVQRMEAIGRLSAGIAHDFNNMLTAILGYGQLLEHDPRLPDSLRNDLGEMMQAARRAESLVRQLQSFSRPTVPERTPTDVNEVVRTMDRLLRRTLGRDVEIVTLLDDQPCLIEGDSARLSQVLMNLAVRAGDVLPAHGRLRISTAVLVADEEFVRSRPGLPSGELVRLEVADNGPTLDEDTLAKVFEPFARLGDERGSGLALTVVQSLVTAMGGHVEAARSNDGGTVFSMYFPHRPDLMGMTVRETPMAEAPGGGERILVVDDEPGVRTLAARMLKSAGYEVAEASNGIEALHLFEQAPKHFDLVLTDMIMPSMSGPELIERLVALRPGVRAICMTGYAHDPFAGIPHAAQVPVLSKPFTRAHLLLCVRQCLDGIMNGFSPNIDSDS